MTQSAKQYQRACELLPGVVNSPLRAFNAVGGNPIFFESGSGAFLTDVDGNRYVDYVMSWGPLILGHAHADVLAKLSETMTKGTSFGAPSPLEIELAELTTSMMPNIEMVPLSTLALRRA